MLIAEDLLLLLTREDSGRLLVAGEQADAALAGAVLIELTGADRVGLAVEGEDAKKGTVVVRDPRPTGDEVLDDALAQLTDSKPRKPKDVVGRLGKHLRHGLYERLAGQGILRSEKGTVLGVFPTSRWPEQDASHERQLRADLADTLVQGIEPAPSTAALIALLHALRAVPKVVEPGAHGITKKDLNARARAVAEGDWGSRAVRQAIDEMTAAVVASTAAVIAAGSGGD
jgi:hypothetical protein